MKKNFVNPSFAVIYDGITANMPQITFYGIIFIYAVTAAINTYFLPVVWYLAAFGAVAIQFGRFAIVFMDFLNPTGRKSPWPAVVASAATLAAIAELAYSLSGRFTGSEYWAILIFGSSLIAMGWLLEINFIAKGAEAFGMKPAGPEKVGAVFGRSREVSVSQPGLGPLDELPLNTEKPGFDFLEEPPSLNGRWVH